MDIDAIIQENQVRLGKLFCPYNQLTGEGSLTERKKLVYKYENNIITLYLPVTMFDDPVIRELNNSGSMEVMLKNAGTLTDTSKLLMQQYIHELRLDHDFEYFAIIALKIKDKESPNIIPFRLNLAQRQLIAEFERQRLLKIPIRVDDLKSRQLGGSTAIEGYIFWIDARLMQNWNSAVCTQVEDQAKNIRYMFERMAQHYPPELGSITLAPYARTKNRIIVERGNILGVGSNEKPDNLRSFDFSMLHLSEIGLWTSTKLKKPEDLIQGLISSVPQVPMSFICKESTAKGVGNYWHNTCLESMAGNSAYKFIFMPWYLAERYTKPIADLKKFITSMTSYDWFQWEAGATLEGINYYKSFKVAETYSDWRMQSEFPTTPEEAFQSTGNRAFDPLYVIQMRKANVSSPLYIGTLKGNSRTGKDSLEGIHFIPDSKGDLYIWNKPDTSIKIAHRYLTIKDIGGRHENADKGVIRVLDRYWLMEGGKPEFVLTWRFNIDQDIAAWRAAMVAKWYCNSLLAIEYNSLVKELADTGDHFLTILDEIVKYYPNIYARNNPENVKQGVPLKYGFHTNKRTKGLIIDGVNAGLRDMDFIDPDNRFYNECDSYEEKPDGSYGAVDGANDDILVTDAIGLWISEHEMPMPFIIQDSYKQTKSIVGEATF